MNFTELMGLASGHVEARIVQAAVELEIFEALETGPLTANALANRGGLEPKACELMLNALASLKLLDKHADLFSLAPIGRTYLLRSSTHYLGGMLRFESSLWHCWENLPQAIRSGNPVRPANMYQEDRNETEIFIHAMDSLVKARGDGEVVAAAVNWDTVDELLDVGSGPATYPIVLCKKFPKLRATIFDLPATLKITERYVRDASLENRINLVAGDYRSDSIPGSYDVIFLSNIIHGESYSNNENLVRRLASSLKLSGRLMIKDHILDDSRANPTVGAIFSLLMLLTTDGGRCYAFNEIRTWMEGAGLSYIEQIDFPPPLTSSLVIGTK